MAADVYIMGSRAMCGFGVVATGIDACFLCHPNNLSLFIMASQDVSLSTDVSTLTMSPCSESYVDHTNPDIYSEVDRNSGCRF